MAKRALKRRKSNTDQEVVPSVADLKRTVVKEHKAAMVAARTTIAHAVRAGEALLQIRTLLLPKDEWTAWIENEFPLNRSQGYLYMRLATYKDLIPPQIESLKGADQLIAGLPGIDGARSRARIDDVRKEEARKWRAEKPPVPWKQIAKRLDLPVSTVYNWFHPKDPTAEKRKRRELVEAERNRNARRLARNNETALAEAYALAERMRDVLGQARREASTQEGIRSIARAEEYHHVTRDSVVAALSEEAGG